MISDLVVIGGGASGFMGAITAISGGFRSVVILEGTSKVLLKKLELVVVVDVI